jgi:hypothetical protein
MESAPEETPAASEPVVEEPKTGTFKTPEAVFEAYENLRRVYDKEQNENRDLKGDIQSLREQVAEMRGAVNVLNKPEPAPQEPEYTQEQIAEWLAQDPAGYANWVAEQASKKADARVRSVEEQLAFERTSRLQQERTQFALANIPELRAVADAGGDQAKMEPGHVDFVQRYTTLIEKYPDLVQSNEKMEIAANAVRMTIHQERAKTEQTRAPKSPAKPPQPAGDVFLESTSGRAATTPTKRAADMTAAELRRQLIDGGTPVLDRG